MFMPTSNTQNLLPFVLRLCFSIIIVLIASIVSLGQTPVPTPSPAPTPITKPGSILVNNPSTVGRISKWVTSSNNGIGTIGDSVIEESSIGTLGIGTNPFSDFKVAVNGGTNLGGLYGNSTGNRTGVYGSSNSGFGVRGQSNSNWGVSGFSSTNVGVFGQSNSSSGVHGFSSISTGVSGQSSSGAGMWGSSTSYIGVLGQSTNYIGTYGFSQNSYGLFGASQNSYGIYAQSATTFAGFFNGPVNATGRLSAGGLLLNSGSFLTFADGTTQSTAATITGVSAGSGLTGGGTTGNVTVSIANGGVNTNQLADSSVTSSKLGVAAVGSTQLADLAVNSTHLADNSVTSPKIADAAITETKIASGTVVKSVNGITDNVTLATGNNVAIAPSGNTLTISSTDSSRRAILGQWWTTTPQVGTNLGITNLAGNNLQTVISDGADVWVPDHIDSVWRVRASDGKVMEQWTGVPGGNFIFSAMGRIFVDDAVTNNLYMIDPSQPAGPVTTAASLPTNPAGIAFDGGRIWIANKLDASVSIITPGATMPWTVQTIPGFGSPYGMLYDGNNIWVTDLGDNKLKKLDSSGNVIQAISVGSGPRKPFFDGINIWVPNFGSNTITVVKAATGNVVNTLSGNGLNGPFGMAFDGKRVLVANFNGDSVSLWKLTDLVPLGSYSTGVGSRPLDVACDGLNFWVSLNGSGKLLRL